MTASRGRIQLEDTVEICRDESCRRVGIHARSTCHPDPAQPKRGRPRKNCPTCKEPLVAVPNQQLRRCEHCDFTCP